MTRSTLVSLSRRAIQFASLFLVAASVTFGGESVNSNQLIGQMVVSAARECADIGQVVVTATRERPLIGQMVVSASRVKRAVLVADLGDMTVTAGRLDDSAVRVADLGEMTVTADRLDHPTVRIADLGEMTVTASRLVTVARNEASERKAAAL